MPWLLVVSCGTFGTFMQTNPSKSVVKEIEQLAKSTQLSIRQIHQKINQKASRGVVGEIIKATRSD